MDQMDSAFFGHEALGCNDRGVRDRKEKEMLKGFLKARETIVIRSLGIARRPRNWIKAAFSSQQSRVGEHKAPPPWLLASPGATS